MSDDDDGDDPQLRSLRAIWLAMPDEDPPQRGLAELMAAARVKAEEMAKPSLWDRVVAMLRRPPVLALATVMVLIGGAVLIGTKRSAMEAEPTVPQATPVQESAPITGSAAPAMGSAAQGEAPIEAPVTEPLPESKPPPPPVKPRPPAKDTKATKSGTDGNQYKAEGDALRKAEESSLELRDDRAEGGKLAAPETVSADGFADTDTQTKGTAAPAPPSNTERARQYVQKAKTALKKNNCDGARAALGAARKLDQAVWTEAQRDPQLAQSSCLTAAE